MAIIRRSAADYLKNAIAQAQTGLAKDETVATTTISTTTAAANTRPAQGVR